MGVAPGPRRGRGRAGARAGGFHGAPDRVDHPGQQDGQHHQPRPVTPPGLDAHGDQGEGEPGRQDPVGGLEDPDRAPQETGVVLDDQQQQRPAEEEAQGPPPHADRGARGAQRQQPRDRRQRPRRAEAVDPGQPALLDQLGAPLGGFGVGLGIPGEGEGREEDRRRQREPRAEGEGDAPAAGGQGRRAEQGDGHGREEVGVEGGERAGRDGDQAPAGGAVPGGPGRHQGGRAEQLEQGVVVQLHAVVGLVGADRHQPGEHQPGARGDGAPQPDRAQGDGGGGCQHRDPEQRPQGEPGLEHPGEQQGVLPRVEPHQPGPGQLALGQIEPVAVGIGRVVDGPVGPGDGQAAPADGDRRGEQDRQEGPEGQRAGEQATDQSGVPQPAVGSERGEWEGVSGTPRSLLPSGRR